jgi:hypothetical protein
VNMYLQAMVRHLNGPPRYAWIVTSTLTASGDDDTKLVEDTESSRNGTTGPPDAPDELIARLKAGEGREWRTLFDVDDDVHPEPEDQRVAHIGRYLHLDDGDELGGDAFGPLHDLSQPDVGATDVQYREPDGTWSSL